MGKQKNKAKKKRKQPQGIVKNLPKNNKLSCNNEAQRRIREKNSWKDRFKTFLSNPTVALAISIVGIVLSAISIVQWFIPNENASNATVAMRNYKSGLISLEDRDLQGAEKHFETAYSIDNNLLDIKYYYAYTEYLLGNNDISYKILQTNRTGLNADEIALYAMYEMEKGNLEKCQEYLDKISEPEKLRSFSFRAYVTTTTLLGFLENYDKGVTEFFLNIDLLNKKIAECHILPNIEDSVTIFEGMNVDFNYINDEFIRIERSEYSDLVIFKRSKLLLFLILDVYSVQYDMIKMPIYYFSKGAECIDYLNYPESTRLLLEFMVLYIKDVSLELEDVEEIIAALEIILKEYNNLISVEEENSIEIIEEYDKELFEMCTQILDDFNNDCFNPDRYKTAFALLDEAGNEIETTTENVLESWSNRPFSVLIS